MRIQIDLADARRLTLAVRHLVRSIIMTNDDQNQTNNEEVACPTQWERDYALKYFELHVAHRAHLFNLMLVFVGAAMLAYTEFLKADEYKLAAVVAVFSSIASTVFLLIGEVTLRKIINAKNSITQNSNELEKVLNCEAKILVVLSDPNLKRFFYLMIISLFAIGALYACQMNSTGTA